MEVIYIYISIGTILLGIGITALIFWKFDIYHKQSRKLVILSIIISQIIFLIMVYRQSDNDKVIISKDDPEQVAIESQTSSVISNQSQIVELYLQANLNAEQKRAIFFDLMAPLGALDPIANPNKTPYVRQIVNFLFGKYSREFGIPVNDVQSLVEAPLRYASTFNEKEYFRKYNNQLETYVSTFENDSDLQILSYWATSLHRVNNYFGDADRAFVWDVEKNESPFYEYKNISKESVSDSIRNITVQKYVDLVNQLYNIEIESIYKCNNRLIFIISGTSNNALGLIYNSTSSDEINCGLLEGRFKVIKDLKLDDKWRYWVAN